MVFLTLPSVGDSWATGGTHTSTLTLALTRTHSAHCLTHTLSRTFPPLSLSDMLSHTDSDHTLVLLHTHAHNHLHSYCL